MDSTNLLTIINLCTCLYGYIHIHNLSYINYRLNLSSCNVINEYVYEFNQNPSKSGLNIMPVTRLSIYE